MQTRIIAILSALTLAGCGMDKIPDKMDTTNDNVGSMNKKMDRTNDGLDKMGGKMDETNGKLDSTTGGLDEMNHKMDETNGGLKDMNSKMDTTNGGLKEMGGKLDKTNEGLDAMAKKVDDTNKGLQDVSGKMDKTNEGLAGVSGKIDKTNETVGTLGDKIDETTGTVRTTNDNLLEMLDEIRKTNTGMEDMTGQMAITNQAIHNQILLLAVDDMLKPENTISLVPPLGMMPAGKKFAEEAKAPEVLELTYTWLTELDAPAPDIEMLKAQGYSDDEAKQLLTKLAHQKQAKFSGLQVIAGLLPQFTAEGLTKEVVENGRYKTEAQSAMYMRAFFLDFYILNSGLLSGKLDRYGKYLDAARYVAQIDYLGRLPFAADIKITSTALGDQPAFDFKGEMTRLLTELDRRYKDDLLPIFRGDEASSDPVVQKQVTDLKAIHEKILRDLAYWRGDRV